MWGTRPPAKARDVWATRRVLRTVEEKHPRTVERLGGSKELSLKIYKMYLDKKFSEGTRSQEAIRLVAKALDGLPSDDKKVADFFLNERSFTDLGSIQEAPKPKQDILGACRGLMDLLIDVDTDSLTRTEMRALERTESVLSKVLAAPRA